MAVLIWQGDRSALTYESLTVSNSAKALTISKIETFGSSTAPQRNEAAGAFITVETAPIRAMFDIASTVSTTAGHLLNAGDSLTIDGKTNLKNVRFIRTTGTDATIQISYWCS